MWITQDEANVMFARYCRARFGKAAREQVRDKAKALKKRGDIDGYIVWNKVADEIEKLDRSAVLNAKLPSVTAA